MLVERGHVSQRIQSTGRGKRELAATGGCPYLRLVEVVSEDNGQNVVLTDPGLGTGQWTGQDRTGVCVHVCLCMHVRMRVCAYVCVCVCVCASQQASPAVAGRRLEDGSVGGRSPWEQSC